MNREPGKIYEDKGVRKVIIAEIIRYNQPVIYETLLLMFSVEVDELPEFKEIKYLMEERRGVAL
ncbi:hypothetical protein [Halocella sp. SP3-1]|uniref:hypothetical protein n=1 Tax=Halocella sp. SP3-1 TaxID=2382161 RepID=UPI000F75D9A2|nr:hypothetical protein [Halocella sp. SP3-1]AZO95263.1 hypothetical protein D7D81_12050 [Halocella sp. SP3-1]